MTDFYEDYDKCQDRLVKTQARAEAAEQRVAFLVAEAHGWQPKLQAAVEEIDRIRGAAEWLLANRGHRGEAQAWKLLAAALAKEDTDE